MVFFKSKSHFIQLVIWTFLGLVIKVKTVVAAEIVETRDKHGFIQCFDINDERYVLDWDDLTKSQTKDVRYFKLNEYEKAHGHKIKNCSDVQYISAISNDILQPIDLLNNDISADMKFEIEQIKNGANQKRNEKTAEEYVQNHSWIFKTDSPEVLSRLQFEVGDLFAMEVMVYFIEKIILNNQPSKDCSAFVGTCDFYLCQESRNPCGIDGYNLSYGYKYCSLSKFKLLHRMSSDRGRNWVGDTFMCLQGQSFKDFKVGEQYSCDTIKEKSFDSHPDCYADAGFCTLGNYDRLQIFNTIKSEILSVQTIKQGFDLFKNCLEELPFF